MRRDGLLLLAFTLSGAAALGYELLWTRLLATGLGSESLAVSGVLAGFFGGMALGSWLLHDRIRRSADPVRLFCILEVIAAAYALLSPHLLYWLAYNLPPLLGPVAGDNSSPAGLLISTLVAGAALLPGTVCMGATIAALVEARRRRFPQDPLGRGVARLYAANTLGATLGVALSVYLLMPRLGLVWASVLLTTLGLAAVLAAALWRRGPEREPPAAGPSPAATSGSPRMAYLLLACSGFAGIGLEVAGVQVLAQIFEDTVFTFANILAVYLLGTAAGAWLYGRLTARLAALPQAAVTASLLLGLTLSVAVTAWLLQASPGLLHAVREVLPARIAGVASEAVVAALVFALPTLLMGAFFSQVCAGLERSGVGRAYAVNTLGSALAPLVFGLLAIPALGYANTVYLAAVVYFLLLVLVMRQLPRRPRLEFGLLAGLAGVFLLAPSQLRLVQPAQGWQVVSQIPGVMGLVTVTEEIGGRSGYLNRALQVNGTFRMGGQFSLGEKRMGHIPLLLTPQAQQALFLGVGTGATLGAASHHALQRLDAVELIPEVLQVMDDFEHVNGGIRYDIGLDLRAADARRFVAASDHRYDIVIADLFHPAKDGAGSLYTLEHFRAVRDSLQPGGVFAQWLPLYQLDKANLQTIVRTFLAVFPEVHSFLGLYNTETPPLLLLGRIPGGEPDRLEVDLGAMAQSMRGRVMRDALLQDPHELMAGYMLDRDALQGFAGAGPLNTDLNPRVLFDAPRTVYRRRGNLTWANLERLLPLRSELHDALLPTAAEQDRERVAAYRRAIGHYLEGELARARDHYPRPLTMDYLQPYLDAYAAQPDFIPARAYLKLVASVQPAQAAQIYDRMLRVTPGDTDLQRRRRTIK